MYFRQILLYIYLEVLNNNSIDLLKTRPIHLLSSADMYLAIECCFSAEICCHDNLMVKNTDGYSQILS